MNQLLMRRISILAAFPVVLLFAGCDTKVEHAGPPVNKAPAGPQSQTVVQGGGAGLGKAKGSADRLADKVADHNREIDKKIEDINK